MKRFVIGGAIAVLALSSSVVVSGGAGAAAKKTPAVKVILLAETKGESANAVPYYADGMGMAAEELGSKVEYSRIAAPLTPDAAQTALLQAIDQKPNAIVGFPASSQVIALQPTIEKSGIPTFPLSSGEQTVATGPSGAPNMFLIRPVDTLIAKAEAEYAIKDLKAKKIGLQCVENATGVNGCNAAKKVIAQNKGVTVFAERTNSIAATDLTEQARAMNGADAILDYNFPNPLAVMSKQLVDNGVNVPHIDGASAGIIANAGAVTGEAATNLKGVDDCVPTVDKRPKVKKWVASYTSKYGTAADLLVGPGVRHPLLHHQGGGTGGIGAAGRDAEGDPEGHVRGHLHHLQGRRAPGAVARGRHREVRRRGQGEHREAHDVRAGRVALHGGDHHRWLPPTTTTAPPA